MKILIFFATYNEAGNVGKLLEGILRAAPAADILVVDDSSADGTVEVMTGLGLTNLTILQRRGKLGLGTAHLLAFCYAAHQEYDVLVTMDGDGSHDPSNLPSLLSKMNEGEDFAIGSRYMPGGSCDYSGYRLRVSQAANLAARVLLGIKLSEFTTSYRAFRVSRLKTFAFDKLLVGGYSFFLTTVVEAARRKMRMAEVPIQFRERGYGTSKIPPFEIFRGMMNLLRLTIIKLFTKHKNTNAQVLMRCEKCTTTYSFVPTHGPARKGAGKCVFCGYCV
jgi:dolichol-phosphate mannosyltransferase